MQPVAPAFTEASGLKHVEQAFPIDSVEGLGEVKFQGNGWSFPLVTDLDKLQSIDECVCDRSAFDKPCLVDVNELGNLFLQSCG